MLLETFTLAQLLKPKEPELPQPKPVQTVKVEPKKEAKNKKTIKTYKVKQGDTLIKIAKKHKTTWKRIYYKNKKISNPDKIKVGVILVLPSNKEVLKPRKTKTVKATPKAQTPVIQAQISSGGANTYEAGQCVWYVKNLRPELPNNWGNATDWLYNAQAQGWPTGSTPRVGAVGWTYGHVVLITGVSGDTVSYTDMNGNWIPFEIGNGTAPASKYSYIY